MRQIATHQHDRVARWQLRAAGLSNSAISRAARSGLLLPRRRGVFAVIDDTPGPFSEATEALLAVNGDAILCHQSALALWGMWESRAVAAPVDVAVGPGGPSRLNGIRPHRITIDPRDVRFRHGLPVTAPSMALIQSALRIDAEELEQVFDAGANGGLTSLPELKAVLSRYGTGPGTVPTRALINEFAKWSYTRSKAERLLLARVQQAGFERPLTNVTRHGFQVDALWPATNVVLEVDGFAFHGDRAAFERDRRRDQVLLAHGFVVVRVTWRQLTREPIAVMVRLGQILSAASQNAGSDG